MAWFAFITIAVLIVIFLVYSGLAISHARKFRYISKRTKLLTTFYIASTGTILFTILILTIFVVDWKF